MQENKFVGLVLKKYTINKIKIIVTQYNHSYASSIKLSTYKF